MTSGRPRDRLGRPVPAGSPLVDPTPVPDVTTCSDAEVHRIAWAFLMDGRPFHAHEVYEERWRVTTGPERMLWRALAQWGAAETHRARGNRIGAQRLAERALSGLHGLEQVPDSADLAAVRARCRAMLDG